LKTLTIFTPAYNRAHLLPRLYESLCKQSISDFEWLVVDDGSSDGTKNLIANFIQEDKIAIKACMALITPPITLLKPN
jgi:glycosyltransferase involved in cell wall biosynthesis